jgi:Flp pilus assembly protein TadB
VARRHQQPEHRPGAANAAGDRWLSDSPLELMIAIALGLAAIATATSVYLNEKQEHRATQAFHQATHRLIEANGLGLQTPHGRAVAAESDREFQHADDQQEKATRYTLIEVILASSLFLYGVGGVAAGRRIKLGALMAASLIFVTALVLLATV